MAGLTKDGECPTCLKRGDNPECGEDHDEFDMTADDAYETLHRLIDEPREIQEKGAIVRQPEPEEQFINFYTCPGDCAGRRQHEPHSWVDRWSCACNDKCPICNAEIEAEDSQEVKNVLL